jgi:RNA polymerase sigma factor (sigma-70 family)
MEGLPGDAEAIARSLDDPTQFGVIFDRHYKAVRRFLTRLVPVEAADDLAAETFLIAFRRRGAFRLEATSARPWLLGIAANLLRRHARQNRRMWRAHLRHAIGREAASNDPWLDADARLDAAALADRLAGALLRLRAQDREVLLLYVLGDLSYEEVAQAMGIPVGTVRSRLARARRIVRELLGEHRAIDGHDE